jgi:hypothetical protein
MLAVEITERIGNAEDEKLLELYNNFLQELQYISEFVNIYDLKKRVPTFRNRYKVLISYLINNEDLDNNIQKLIVIMYCEIIIIHEHIAKFVGRYEDEQEIFDMMKKEVDINDYNLVLNNMP